jgi:Transposase domain (DUF772)
MQPPSWQPPVALSEQEEQIVKKIRKAKLFVFLREHRHELFNEAFQQELANLYRPAERGQPPIAPAMLALALILQASMGISDDEVIEAHMDRRLIERTIEVAAQSQAFGSRALRAALESSPLWGAGRVEDTSNLVGHARKPGHARGGRPCLGGSWPR